MIFKNASLSAGLAVLALAMTFAGRARADAYLPPGGGAACLHWDTGGPWEIVQSNGPSVVLKPFEREFAGSARYWDNNRLAYGEAVYGYTASGSFHGFHGYISGNYLEFKVWWDNGAIGVYTGKIDSEGHIQGTTYDETHPQTTASWYRKTTAQCLRYQAIISGPEAPGSVQECREMGLNCDELPIAPPPPVKAQGRVKLDPTETDPNPPRAICDLARQARARNSPAAPGLEAKCRAAGAAGETPPVKAQGRVNLSPAGGAPPRPICDVAREARTRNSPAAPGLEEKCRIDLAAKGAAIAQMDESVAAARTAERARTAETEVLYRQGFDIATGIFGNPALGAQGNTAMGPGSEGIRKSLDSTAGQRGFDASVAFHLNQTYPH